MVGKKIVDAFYIHRKYIHLLEPQVKVLYNEALSCLGHFKDHNWNLVKINAQKSCVSFLFYPRFDDDAHPELEYSMYVNLTQSSPTVRLIKGGGKIIHRKELFIGKDYTNFETFTELTKHEENLGLLDRKAIFKGKKLGVIMGQKHIWNQWLEFKGVQIEGHRLFQGDEIE